MARTSFRTLSEEARKHDDYWVELAILEIGEKVTQRMAELGLSRAELARRLGTSPAYVTKILRGSTNFTLATIVKLGRALDSEVRFELTPRGSTTHEPNDLRRPHETLGTRRSRSASG